MKLSKLLLLLPLILIPTTSLWASYEPPFRTQFAKIKTITHEEIQHNRSKMILFDVRSAYEYNTMHIKEARHLSLNDKNFVTTLQKLRKAENRSLVFYCNGFTCKKSYKAARKALRAGIDRVYAYDAGVFDWIKQYPKESVLLGKSPVELHQLISTKNLNAHMLEPSAFALRVGDDAITLDIRDRLQAAATKLFPTRQRTVPLDNDKLKAYIERAKQQKKTLLVYDAFGTQVRWLQYYIESTGLQDYYFMRGGVKAFLDPEKRK